MFAFLLLAQAVDVSATQQTNTTQAPICMTRSVTDAKQRVHAFPIVVTSADEATLVTRGFVVTPCAATKLKSQVYQADVCRMAAMGNEAVQNRLEQVFGVQPKLLCDTSKRLGTALTTALGG